MKKSVIKKVHIYVLCDELTSMFEVRSTFMQVVVFQLYTWYVKVFCTWPIFLFLAWKEMDMATTPGLAMHLAHLCYT
jgi:hypothetical protein